MFSWFQKAERDEGLQRRTLTSNNMMQRSSNDQRQKWERRLNLAGLVFQTVCTRIEAAERQNDNEKRADKDTTLQDMVVTTAQLPISQNPSDTAAQRTIKND